MSKLNQRIRYTCSGYRYAPESFRSYKVIIDPSGRGNHTYIELKLKPEQEREIGNVCITKGKEAACALAKRYDRERSKRPRQFITYGFFELGSRTTYHYSPQIYCRPDAPLRERLWTFKRFKDYVEDQGCKIERFTQCKLDGHYRPVDIEKVYSAIDITRPVLVRLRAA